jgi:hypothetical protein
LISLNANKINAAHNSHKKASLESLQSGRRLRLEGDEELIYVFRVSTRLEQLH